MSKYTKILKIQAKYTKKHNINTIQTNKPNILRVMAFGHLLGEIEIRIDPVRTDIFSTE